MRRGVQCVDFPHGVVAEPGRRLARHAVAVVVELFIERQPPVIEPPEPEEDQEQRRRQRQDRQRARDERSRESAEAQPSPESDHQHQEERERRDIQ